MHVTFKDHDGKLWRIELGDAVLAAYAIGAEALPKWLAEMQRHGRLWETVRRRYAVRPALGGAASDAVPKSEMEVAAALTAHSEVNVTELMVRSDLERSVTAWKRAVAERESQAARVKAGDGDRTDLPEKADAPKSGVGDDFQDRESVTMRRARTARLMEKFGFVDEDPEVQGYLSERIGQLEQELDSDEDRPAAMQMLRNEVTLFFSINPALTMLQKRIREVVREGETHKDIKSLAAWQEQEKELIGSQAKLSGEIEKAKETLGLGESATGAGQVAERMREDVSYLVHCVRAWHADGDKRPLDGVFSGPEINVLCTPWQDRRGQYRPELPIMVQQLADGLFDPQFKGIDLGKGQREALRRLRAGFHMGLEKIQTDEMGGIESIQDEEDIEPEAPVAPVRAEAVNAQPVQGAPAIESNEPPPEFA